MKKLIALYLLLVSFSGMAQFISRDITNDEYPFTWLGLDFSEARFIKSLSHPIDAEAVSEALPSWNSKVISNRKKFPLEESFHRNTITRNTVQTDKVNATVDISGRVTEDLYLLYTDDIRTAFEKYDLTGLEPGIAMSYMVEAIDVNRREFSGYMVAIDVPQKRIIKTYYVKVRFPYDPTPEELILPFRQVLNQFSKVLDDKD